MGNGESAPSEYVLDDPLAIDSAVPWQMHQAICKLDGAHMSVFVYDESTDDEEKQPGPARDLGQYADNAVKHMKKLRHPGVMKLLDVEYEDDAISLLTEEVTPLALVLNDLGCDEICAGLYNVIETLTFLHETAHLCHNNICTASIFVSRDGTWKIGGMDHMCRFEAATPTFLTKMQGFRFEKAVAPEEKAESSSSRSLIGPARDAYAFGVFAEELLEYLTDLGDQTKTFELRIQDEFLSHNPGQRPQLSSLLHDRLFSNDFTDIINFLKHVTLKPQNQKEQFFRTLTNRLRDISPHLVAGRLVPLLMSRFVLLEPLVEEFLLPHLLAPISGDEKKLSYQVGDIDPILPKRLFCKHVVPQIFKLFHVRETQVRKILLRQFHSFAHCFDAQVLQEVIMPKILMGLRDTDDEIVYFTLHALAELVPILGGVTVIGGAQFKLFTKNFPKMMMSELTNHNNDVNLLADVPKPPKMDQSKKQLAKQAEREERRRKAKLLQEERKKQREKQQLKASKRRGRKMSGQQEPRSDEEEEKEIVSSPFQHQGYQDNHEESVSESDNDEDEEYSSGSDFDREIEDQISSMPSTLAETSRLSARPFEPAPAVDWSDVKTSDPRVNGPGSSSSTPSTRGILKLKVSKSKTKTKTSPPPEIENEKWDETADDWESWNKGSPRSLPSPSARSKSKRTSSRTDSWNSGWGSVDQEEESAAGWGDDWGSEELDPTMTPKSSILAKSTTRTVANQPLGSEFDIMSIQVKKTVSAEEDIFADMTPNLETTRPNLTGAHGDERRESQDGSVSRTNLFAVEESLEDAAGWDNDVQWEDPDE